MEGVHCTKIVHMLTLKHEISSPIFYELLIKTEIKEYTDTDFNKFYNYIMICLNVVTIIIEYFLPAYKSIKRHSDFE